jgi:hypothetical protein
MQPTNDQSRELFPESVYEPIIDGILADGYGMLDNFLSPAEVAALASRLRTRREAGQFRPAAIGNQQVTVEKTVRGDEILTLRQHPKSRFFYSALASSCST